MSDLVIIIVFSVLCVLSWGLVALADWLMHPER
jgi:hypothetical protein